VGLYISKCNSTNSTTPDYNNGASHISEMQQIYILRIRNEGCQMQPTIQK